MQKVVMWAPEEGDKLVITKDSKHKTYRAGDIFTVHRAMLDSFSVTVTEKPGVVIPYEDYQMIPPTKNGIELDSTKLKVTYYDAKIGHAAALDSERRMYYSRDNLKTWQEVQLEENDEKRMTKDVVITVHARVKQPSTEFLIAGELDKLIAEQELFQSWGTTVRGKNWQVDPVVRPNHMQAHIEEKVATRMLCAIEELSKSPAINQTVQFVAMKDGKPHHIPADRIHGVYEALHAKFVDMKDWCWIQEAEKELAKARSIKGDIALALGLPEVASFDEIASKAIELKQMGDQMERLKAEYKNIKENKKDAGDAPSLTGKVTDRSPFKSDLRRPNNVVGIAGNEALQQAVAMVTNLIAVPLTEDTDYVVGELPPESVDVKDEVKAPAPVVELTEVLDPAPTLEPEVVADVSAEATETVADETLVDPFEQAEVTVSILSAQKVTTDAPVKKRKSTPRKGKATK